MTKNEIKTAIIAALPNNRWELKRLSTKHTKDDAGSFVVISPLEERMSNKYETYRRKISKICKAANAICTGGGCFIGSDTYDNYFYIKKA